MARQGFPIKPDCLFVPTNLKPIISVERLRCWTEGVFYGSCDFVGSRFSDNRRENRSDADNQFPVGGGYD